MNCAHSIEYGQATKVLDDYSAKLVGEVLTVVEAVVPEGSQRDATRTLIKKAIWQFNRNVKSGFDEMRKLEEETNDRQ